MIPRIDAVIAENKVIDMKPGDHGWIPTHLISFNGQTLYIGTDVEIIQHEGIRWANGMCAKVICNEPGNYVVVEDTIKWELVSIRIGHEFEKMHKQVMVAFNKIEKKPLYVKLDRIPTEKVNPS